MIDEDAAHDGGRDGEEVRAVAPLHAPLIDEPQVALVHERGGLERVLASLAAHGALGVPAQLLVDRGDEPVRRGLVAASPGEEEPGDVRRLRRRRIGRRDGGAGRWVHEPVGREISRWQETSAWRGNVKADSVDHT